MSGNIKQYWKVNLHIDINTEMYESTQVQDGDE